MVGASCPDGRLALISHHAEQTGASPSFQETGTRRLGTALQESLCLPMLMCFNDTPRSLWAFLPCSPYGHPLPGTGVGWGTGEHAASRLYPRTGAQDNNHTSGTPGAGIEAGGGPGSAGRGGQHQWGPRCRRHRSAASLPSHPAGGERGCCHLTSWSTSQPTASGPRAWPKLCPSRSRGPGSGCC